MTLQEEVNVFLNNLRETGAINMFGAAPYVAETFDVSKKEARDLLKNWMETFAERHKQEIIVGLDMYLNASKYLSDYIAAEKEKKEEMLKLFPELKAYLTKDTNPIKHVVAEVGYWRKANAIHNWFVQNVQEGEDDCKSYYVSRESLEELKNLCQRVLVDNKLAQELLPPTSGFFFGSTEPDEYYFTDLRSTIEIIDRALALPNGWVIGYQSSW